VLRAAAASTCSVHAPPACLAYARPASFASFSLLPPQAAAAAFSCCKLLLHGPCERICKYSTLTCPACNLRLLPRRTQISVAQGKSASYWGILRGMVAGGAAWMGGGGAGMCKAAQRMCHGWDNPVCVRVRGGEACAAAMCQGPCTCAQATPLLAERARPTPACPAAERGLAGLYQGYSAGLVKDSASNALGFASYEVRRAAALPCAPVLPLEGPRWPPAHARNRVWGTAPLPSACQQAG
jgi:hypothetical protein